MCCPFVALPERRGSPNPSVLAYVAIISHKHIKLSVDWATMRCPLTRHANLLSFICVVRDGKARTSSLATNHAYTHTIHTVP